MSAYFLVISILCFLSCGSSKYDVFLEVRSLSFFLSRGLRTIVRNLSFSWGYVIFVIALSWGYDVFVIALGVTTFS